MLQELSRTYQNVMEVQLTGKTVTDVEYRVVHNSQKQLVVESTHLLPVSDEQSDLITKYRVTMIEEMHLLKMLANPKYISEIKEEIIVLSPDGSEITQYAVVHEKSEINLDNLPEMWKFKSAPLENYTPEKLAYYFFQALGIINFLHDSNVYHGSIRPYAFEIYRDQSMKISDLQYGLKMKDDSAKNADREIYQLKALPPLSSDETTKRHASG